MTDRSARWTFSRRWVLRSCAIALGSLALGGPSIASDLRRTAAVKAFQNARGSVVSIRGEKTIGVGAVATSGTEANRRVNGMGTGVVIDERGYVLTNHHVVDGVREIQVTLDDNRKVGAKLVNRHPETDLAIIKLELPEGARLPVIPIGTSSDLMPAEPVIAVGNAFGYEQTISQGIISALGRQVQVSEAQFYDDLIQTDASINPGNSGGPLLNIDGEMIGINVAVRAQAQNIGFAIPVDKALTVAGELLASAGLKSNWHGVVTAKGLANQGALVAAVDDKSPAEKSGLKPGDVVVAVKRGDGKLGEVKVARALDFHRALIESGAGDKVELTVRRNNAELAVQIALADPPAGLKPSGSPMWEVLGLELKPVAAEEFREQYQKFLKEYRGGLTVTAVRPQSPAAEQGIRRGDVLVGMHIWETVTMQNVDYVLTRPDFASFTPIKFWILRGSQAYFGFLPVNAAQLTASRK
jgi:serine protease Do